MLDKEQLEKEINILTNSKKSKVNFEKIRKMLINKKISYDDVTGKYNINSEFDLRIEFKNCFFIISYCDYNKKYKVYEFIIVRKEVD